MKISYRTDEYYQHINEVKKVDVEVRNGKSIMIIEDVEGKKFDVPLNDIKSLVMRRK